MLLMLYVSGVTRTEARVGAPFLLWRRWILTPLTRRSARPIIGNPRIQLRRSAASCCERYILLQSLLRSVGVIGLVVLHVQNALYILSEKCAHFIMW